MKYLDVGRYWRKSQSKDAEARYLINLLDNIFPLVLDFHPIIFRSGSWSAYKEAMFRVWDIFYQYHRKNYNKLPLAFLSDTFYWASTNHPLSQVLTDSLCGKFSQFTASTDTEIKHGGTN